MLLTMPLIASCQNTIERIDTACSWVRPITTTKEDRAALSRKTKEQIAAHNELYDSRCGPPAKEK